jgi:chitinase
MKTKTLRNLAFCVFFLLLLNLNFALTDYIFPCYYVYEPATLKPESIPVDLCTHIIILGCVYEQTNETIANILKKPYDCSIVLTKLANLKQQNPSLKLILSMATNKDAMHIIVKKNQSIEDYTNSAIRLALDYKFDGIDLDWEYPCDLDKFKFTLLLENFREKITRLRLNLTLSAAIGAGFNTINLCYDLNGLSLYLDYINVMCYDYNTIWNTYTAYASPLFARPEETGYDATLNSNFTINYLLDQNVPREKIVLGLNAGGHTFQLADPKNRHGFHAPVLGVGYSSGWSLYPQLCEMIRTRNGVSVYDEVAEVLYGYYDDQWSNTGDVRSAKAKSKWAKSMNLAGVFTWCLNWDDLFNICGHNVTFPIHRTIKNELFTLN